MKFSIVQRNSVSMVVLAAFASLLFFWTAPVAAATASGNSETAITPSDNNRPGFLEKENGVNPVVKKGKKIPWLIVGLGALAVGIVVVLLLIKKPSYELKVSMAAGVSGTPAETSKYKKGKAVNYNYSTLTGYMALVTLDGVGVPAKGTVTMDKDHTLAVTAEPSYTLTVSISANAAGTPAATTAYKQGAVLNYSYTASTGYGVEVKLDGVNVPASGTITMDKDKTLVVNAEFLDIRGNWELSMVYLTPGRSIYNYTSIWTFEGSRESGTFTEIAGTITNYGTYTVTNLENVWFKYTDTSDTFVGKITGKQMSGTFASGSDYNGTWSGSKL